MCGRIKAADAHRQDATLESRMDMAERSEAWKDSNSNHILQLLLSILTSWFRIVLPHYGTLNGRRVLIVRIG